MRLPRWALSQRDGRSYILDDDVRHAFALVARCGHEIDIGTEPVVHMVPCTPCAALLVLELLRALEVNETEAREWLAEWRHG